MSQQEFVSPRSLSAAQRACNSSALQDRIASAMNRVATDTTQTRQVRAANTRDMKTARAMASRMRQTQS